MFIHKSPLVLLFLSGIVGLSTASAQHQDKDSDQPYSLASVNGEFALVGTYSGGIARQLGVIHIKDGDVTGFLRVNVPGSMPSQRVVVYLPFTGTITIAEDGTGVTTVTVTYPDNSLHEATLDILITKAREGRGIKIATEIASMQRETPALSPDSFIVGTLTRRPQ